MIYDICPLLLAPYMHECTRYELCSGAVRRTRRCRGPAHNTACVCCARRARAPPASCRFLTAALWAPCAFRHFLQKSCRAHLLPLTTRVASSCWQRRLPRHPPTTHLLPISIHQSRYPTMLNFQSASVYGLLPCELRCRLCVCWGRSKGGWRPKDVGQ